MSAAHTAGEWTKPGLSRLERVRAYRAEFGGEIGVAVAAVDAEIYRQERDGRLRLAAAAPDLLEALQKATLQIAVWRSINGDMVGALVNVEEECRAAIAKATGQ